MFRGNKLSSLFPISSAVLVDDRITRSGKDLYSRLLRIFCGGVKLGKRMMFAHEVGLKNVWSAEELVTNTT